MNKQINNAYYMDNQIMAFSKKKKKKDLNKKKIFKKGNLSFYENHKIIYKKCLNMIFKFKNYIIITFRIGLIK